MKKQSLLLLAIAGSICLLHSCAFTPCTTMSANLGLVNSHIVGESDSWGPAFGAQAGLAAELPFNCDFPLTAWAGTNLTMQGASWEEDWGEGLIKGTTRTWNLNIPLTARYPFGNGFYAEAGLQPGFMLSAKDRYDGDAYDVKDWFKTFDLGIPLGVGYDFENNFGLNLRVVPGVTNINGGEYESYKDRNLVVVLGGTYTLTGKKQLGQ